MNDSKNDIRKIGVGKWPGLLVSGEYVTTDQAAEILFRTFSFDDFCNGTEWMKEVSNALDLPPRDNHIGWEVKYQENIQRFHKEHNHIELEFLFNQRIWSSWVGGPHGWVDWDGRVHTACYNIGKWPSVTSVEEDWTLLAEAFPFLDLTCQLINKEITEEGQTEPLVEFRIKGGNVIVQEPGPLLMEPENIFDGPFDLMERNERGCTIEQLMRGKVLSHRM